MKCKKCGGENLSIMFELIVSAPIKYYHNFSKQAMRDKSVRLWGADWHKADIVCGDCFYSTALDKQLTNADRIRGMTDEELANLLWAQNGSNQYWKSTQKYLDWLQQPAKEEA